MKKPVLLVTLVSAALLSVSVLAAESPAPSNFWEKLRKKIELLTPQKKMTATNAVGGVRGAASESSDLYWKGEAVRPVVDEEELQAFQKAMTLAGDAAQSKEALAAFEAFVKAHPESSLRTDAEQAMAALH